MISTGAPTPSLKRQLRSTANAARKQCKRHAGGASLNRRKPIVTRYHMPAVSYCAVYRFQTHVSIT